MKAESLNELSLNEALKCLIGTVTCPIIDIAVESCLCPQAEHTACLELHAHDALV